MQDKITFESVLKECGFVKIKGFKGVSVFEYRNRQLRCTIDSTRKIVFIEKYWVPLTKGGIRSPLRLKILLDILLETHDRPTSE